jgi:hypothetical protein
MHWQSQNALADFPAPRLTALHILSTAAWNWRGRNYLTLERLPVLELLNIALYHIDEVPDMDVASLHHYWRSSAKLHSLDVATEDDEGFRVRRNASFVLCSSSTSISPPRGLFLLIPRDCVVDDVSIDLSCMTTCVAGWQEQLMELRQVHCRRRMEWKFGHVVRLLLKRHCLSGPGPCVFFTGRVRDE